MSKITLTNLVNLQNETTAVNAINANNAVLTAALDNTLSRDGTAPDQMQAPLDMNSNQIVNLPAPISTSSPVRLQDITALTGGGTIITIPPGGNSGQILTKNSATNFDVLWANPANNVVIAPPGGRLTLTAGVPVMTSSIPSGTTIYYAPYVSQYIPINIGGTVLTLLPITSSPTDSVGLSVNLGSNWAANSNHDWFVFSNSGVVTLGSGPDWSQGAVAGSNTMSASVRGTGAGSTALQLYNGILTNANAILLRTSNATTVNVPANAATYVGTTRTAGAGVIPFQYGSISTNGGTAFLYVWNTFNQVQISTTVSDSTALWTYSSNTIRASNGSTGNRVNFLTGLAGGCVNATNVQLPRLTVAGAACTLGLALNSTTVFDIGVQYAPGVTGQVNAGQSVTKAYSPVLGANYISANEEGDGTNTTTFFGLSGIQFSGLTASLVM